jgi:D-alanine-D-alanine ligase
METIAVLFGGRSVEHEVSVVTALQVMENLDPTKYTALPIYIAKDGTWYTSERFKKIDSFKQDVLPQTLREAEIVKWNPVPGSVVRIESQDAPMEKRGWFAKTKTSAPASREVNIDAVIPALHGTYGEDGSVQGFLELTGVPYTSAGVVGSAVGMDKIVMKAVFKGSDIPVVKYDWFTREDWEGQSEAIITRLVGKLKFPMFVKPCNLGSSVGISRAENEDELRNAIEIAKHYDTRILVEEGVENAIEINVSVLGDELYSQASLCERPVSWEAFLTYEDKYIRGNFNKGSSAAREIPARLPDGMTEQIQALAKRAFHAVQAKGVVRVDFLVSETNEVYVNEINTIPGSLAFYLWEPTGLSYRNMLTELIEIAKRTARRKAQNVTSFETELLEKFQGQKFQSTKLQK